MNAIQRLTRLIDEENLWNGTLTVKRSGFLCSEGDVETRVFHVLEGCLRIYMVDETQEHSIRFAYKGDFITALDSFLTGKPTVLYIQAIRQSTIRWLAQAPFHKLISDKPAASSFWQNLLSALVVQQMEREHDLLTSSPKNRYNRVLARSPQLFQEVPHKYIASYLRMTPETLSRMKKS